MSTELIYGKNDLTRIVSIEDKEDGTAEIFRELEDGSVVSQIVDNKYYLLFTEQHSPKFKRLAGNQPYCWLWETDSRDKYREVLSNSYKNRYDMHIVRDPKESLMVREGYTYYKDMTVSDVSVLSFDLEHKYGIVQPFRNDGTLLIISNTFRKQGKVYRKLFRVDHFNNEGEMLKAWCDWVREINPSILLAHNEFGHDLQILKHASELTGVPLELGRDGSEIRFAERVSQFRKDGSQAYDYTNAWIYGREIVDSYFLALKGDIGRKYESYGLKAIIKAEGLEREGRHHYDASKIATDWEDLNKREHIVAYATDDADDSLKIFDLYIPSLFYYARSIPRSLQQIVNSATGSQINSVMVRAYLQKGHSIAKASEVVEFEGAISMGVPGIHKNVFKIDVASLYPMIMLMFKIYNKEKDPEALSLKILRWYTDARLENKRKAKETGNRLFLDLSEAMKIVINSFFGFMGAPKLNYNFPFGAAEVCRKGREILQSAFRWASGKEYNHAA